MNISEMRSREDFDRIFSETLSLGWSEQFRAPVEVALEPRPGADPWRTHPLLNAYFFPGAGPACRRYLRDSFAFTPVWTRLAAQWALASCLASPLGLRLLSRRGFWVRPRLPRAAERLVVPGNQRIRTFDFGAGKSRVFLKRGFGDRAFLNELRVRGAGESGPFLPVTASNAAQGWFEEDIVEGWALPRCPPWVDRTAAERQALEALEGWLRRTTRAVPAADAAERLGGRLEEAVACLPAALRARDVLLPWRDRLGARAARSGSVELAVGHGDFQPGNLLVRRDGRTVVLIDWEHARDRYREYDRFVYALRSRSGRGLAGRIRAFLEGSAPRGLEAFGADRSLRAGAIAFFLLEDLLWFAEDSVAGPYRVASSGLVNYLRELPILGEWGEAEAWL